MEKQQSAPKQNYLPEEPPIIPALLIASIIAFSVAVAIKYKDQTKSPITAEQEKALFQRFIEENSNNPKVKKYEELSNFNSPSGFESLYVDIAKLNLEREILDSLKSSINQ